MYKTGVVNNYLTNRLHVELVIRGFAAHKLLAIQMRVRLGHWTSLTRPARDFFFFLGPVLT